MPRRRGRSRLIASAALAALALGTAPALAVTVTVTGDDGSPVAVNGPVSIRYINPNVALTLAANEHYGFTVTAPGGAMAAVEDSCATSGQTRLVNYFGNGAYTVNLTQYPPGDSSCSRAPTGRSAVQFSINAGVGLGGPTGPVLTRRPGSLVTNRITLPVSLNPGAIANQLFYAVNSALAADGSLATPAGQLVANASAGTVDVPLDKGPGTYQLVARAEGSNTAGDVFTPWSRPVQFRALAPFDVKKLSFPDRKGPSYRLRATFNEPSVSGRVSIALAKGSRAGTYRSLGSVRVSHHAVTKRFFAGAPGTYRVRFRYKGNATVAAGFEVDKIRVTRRITAPGASAASVAG